MIKIVIWQEQTLGGSWTFLDDAFYDTIWSAWLDSWIATHGPHLWRYFSIVEIVMKPSVQVFVAILLNHAYFAIVSCLDLDSGKSRCGLCGLKLLISAWTWFLS